MSYIKQPRSIKCKCGHSFEKIEKTEAGGKVYRAEISALYKCNKCGSVRKQCYITYNPYYETNIKVINMQMRYLKNKGITL